MHYVVSESSKGKRLDHYVSEKFPELSRSYLRQQIDKGNIVVNGEQVKAGYTLRPADKITISVNLDHVTPQKITLPTVYEDDDCLVIIKPEGLLTHSKGVFNPEATVASSTADKTSLTGERAGIVHRLDRGTSGLIIVAKNPLSLQWLQKQFSQRKVKKTYYAVVSGQLQPAEAVIDVPIERNPRDPKRFTPGLNGKPATTAYRVVASNQAYSLVELKPQTGRTHQLRVHLKHLGHPIVGDSFYGGEVADRLYLHAAELELTLPNRQRAIFKAPLPESFNKYAR